MSAHTPGPWRVRNGRFIVATRGQHEGEVLAAPTYWMETFPDEATANAALIAKAPIAPTLAEALDPDTLEAIADEISGFGHSARVESLRILARRQRAALAEWEAQ